jgi:hypothetical protein
MKVNFDFELIKFRFNNNSCILDIRVLILTLEVDIPCLQVLNHLSLYYYFLFYFLLISLWFEVFSKSPFLKRLNQTTQRIE